MTPKNNKKFFSSDISKKFFKFESIKLVSAIAGLLKIIMKGNIDAIPIISKKEQIIVKIIK
jgi:hypothetical protein